MGNFDLFDLIKNVSFDPPEKKAKEVSEAFKTAVRNLNGELGGQQDDAKRKEINDKLEFLKAKHAEVFDSNGKLTDKFQEFANDRTEAEIDALRSTLELFAQPGRNFFTKSDIRTQKKKNPRLEKESIEEAYRRAGFNPQEKKDSVAPFPEFADEAYALLEAIRSFPDYQKVYPSDPCNTDVNDLYDLFVFLGEIEGESPEPKEWKRHQDREPSYYKDLSTEKLRKILDAHTIDRALKGKIIGPCKSGQLAEILTKVVNNAKTYVFNSKDNREKYQKYLQYKTPEMVDLFNRLKRASVEDLENLKSAEPIIKRIANVFGSRDEAIEVYNFATRANYEGPPKVYIPCAYCKGQSEFVSVKEAEDENACDHCKRALFKVCNKCQEKVLTSDEKCPNPQCGFLFPSIEKFNQCIILAENALLQPNFNEARKHLSQAKAANPSEKTKTGDLAARIDKEEAVYEKPLSELRTLISEKKFMAAAEALSRTIASFPKLNVSAYEAQINAMLEKVRSDFTLAQKRSPAECANACIDILDICQDFKPALEFLRVTPPEPVKNVTSSMNVIDGWTSLNWQGTGEKGVTYCVVRKEGKAFPKNELDGTRIKDGLSEMVYRDENVPPGTWYSYSVFAKRMGVCSSAMGTAVLLLAEVKDVRHEQVQESLRITWTMPKNCVGVRVSRTDQNGEVVLAENAQTSYEDKRVSYGNTYSYTLKANYAGHASSNGTRMTVTPMIKINNFSIEARQAKGNTYTVSWDIPNKGIDVRILVDGKNIREAKSDAKKCDIELPANGYHVVEVSAFSQSRWITSQNSIEINTYLPHKIDRSRTQVQEREVASAAGSYAINISASLQEPIPGNVKGFYYAVRTKSPGMQSPPWAEVREAETKAPGIVYKDISDYRAKQKISCSLTVKEEDVFYLSLFTNYVANGKDVISAPEKIRISRPVVGDILWSVRKPLLGGQTKLCIEVRANQSIDQQPKLILCACGENEFLTSVNDSRAVRIGEFEEQAFALPQSAYIKEYAINASLSKRQKFFLFCESQDENQSFTTKWAKGFSGKL